MKAFKNTLNKTPATGSPSCQAMLAACWEKAGALVHQQIIWVKERGVLTRSHYLWKHEPCFMGRSQRSARKGSRAGPARMPNEAV